MSVDFPVPNRWRQQWRLKILDRERSEPPHATLMRGPYKWRWSLRTGAFLDRDPPARDVPPELILRMCELLPELIAAWDHMYPENPVFSAEGDHD